MPARRLIAVAALLAVVAPGCAFLPFFGRGESVSMSGTAIPIPRAQAGRPIVCATASRPGQGGAFEPGRTITLRQVGDHGSAETPSVHVTFALQGPERAPQLAIDTTVQGSGSERGEPVPFHSKRSLTGVVVETADTGEAIRYDCRVS